MSSKKHGPEHKLEKINPELSQTKEVVLSLLLDRDTFQLLGYNQKQEHNAMISLGSLLVKPSKITEDSDTIIYGNVENTEQGEHPLRQTIIQETGEKSFIATGVFNQHLLMPHVAAEIDVEPVFQEDDPVVAQFILLEGVAKSPDNSPDFETALEEALYYSSTEYRHRDQMLEGEEISHYDITKLGQDTYKVTITTPPVLYKEMDENHRGDADFANENIEPEPDENYNTYWKVLEPVTAEGKTFAVIGRVANRE